MLSARARRFSRVSSSSSRTWNFSTASMLVSRAASVRDTASASWRLSARPQCQWFRLHQTAVYFERQTQFGDIPRPLKGSAGVFLESAQAVAHGVRMASRAATLSVSASAAASSGSFTTLATPPHWPPPLSPRPSPSVSSLPSGTGSGRSSVSRSSAGSASPLLRSHRRAATVPQGVDGVAQPGVHNKPESLATPRLADFR